MSIETDCFSSLDATIPLARVALVLKWEENYTPAASQVLTSILDAVLPGVILPRMSFR